MLKEHRKQVEQWREMLAHQRSGGAPFWCDPEKVLEIIDLLAVESAGKSRMIEAQRTEIDRLRVEAERRR
jgi:hypothetical protein